MSVAYFRNPLIEKDHEEGWHAALSRRNMKRPSDHTAGIKSLLWKREEKIFIRKIGADFYLY